MIVVEFKVSELALTYFATVAQLQSSFLVNDSIVYLKNLGKSAISRFFYRSKSVAKNKILMSEIIWELRLESLQKY